jgi:hypothetical protein
MYSHEAMKREIKTAEKFKSKYYVKYVYLDDSGDYRPTYSWEEETYESIEELGNWVARRMESDSDFSVVEVKKLVDLEDEEWNQYRESMIKGITKLEEERREREKQALREREERKKKDEDERYKLYLKLKEKYENK